MFRAQTSNTATASRPRWEPWLSERSDLAIRVLLITMLLQLVILALRAGNSSAPSGSEEMNWSAATASQPKDPAWLAPEGKGSRGGPATPANHGGEQTDRVVEGMSGQVVDAAGQGLAARVVLRAADGRHLETQSEANGSFRLEAFESVEMSVEAILAGYRTKRLEGVRSGVPIKIKLERGTGLSGRVVDLSGRAVADAQIEVRGSGGYRELRRTDADGNYEIPRPASGMLNFTIAASGYDVLQTARVPVRVDDDGIEDWVLQAGISFSARIVDARTGTAVKGVMVAMEPAGMMAPDDLRRKAYPQPMSTADDGIYRCDGLPRGGVILTLAAPGYVPLSQTLRMDESVRGEQEFALDRGRTVKGRIETSAARPPAGLMVAIEQLSEFGQWAETGSRLAVEENGRFRFDAVSSVRPLRVVAWQGQARAGVSDRIEPNADDVPLVRLVLE